MLKPPWILGALCLLAAVLGTEAGSNLYVVAPNILRVNTDEEVWVTQHNTQNSAATVKLHLEDYPLKQRTFSHRTVTVNKDESKKVTMRVGWNEIPHGSQQSYAILVAECAAQSFRKESIILLSKNSGYLFLQTDKPIYQPHQKVHIQIVSLDSDMKPSNLKFNVDVINPKAIAVRRYPDKTATNGILQEDFELPNVLVFGNWTVLASYKDNSQPLEKKSAVQFEVKEYVLPTFSVRVKFLNGYILSNQAEVQFKMTSRYVFNAPVKGSAKMAFYLVHKDGTETILGHRKGVEIIGDTIASIERNEFGNHWFPPEGTRLKVKVTVTEASTGKQESGEDSSAVFVQSPYVISVDRMPKFFRPGLPFILKADVTYPNKNAAVAIPISIEALVKVGARQEGAHGNNARVINFSTDENGRKDITLDIPAGATELKIKISTRQTPTLNAGHQRSKEITLSPHSSRSNEFMAIMLNSMGTQITVNNDIEIRVDFTTSVSKKVNFMIIARGKILKHFVKTVADRRSTHQMIPITPLMSPQARIVAYYSTSGGDVVSDSMVLEVVKACGSELTIRTSNGKREFMPKDDKVTFKVKAGKAATVSVLGVDQAVYLLSEKDVLTRSKMFKKMIETDVGCGPGGGRDTRDVFEKAGLSILVKTGNVANPKRAAEGCAQKTFRMKRGVRETVQDILNRLPHRDKECCNHGSRDSVDVSNTCRNLARMYGSRGRMACTIAYKQCCDAQRIFDSLERGRSGPDDNPFLSGRLDGGGDVQIQTRSNFPETWFNELFTFGPNQDSSDLIRTLPDSITTWVISGVSVSRTEGMCVAKPYNITAKKTFFVHVDLPYSAVRNEQLEVKATVYNLGKQRLERVHVMMKSDGDLCYAATKGKYTYRQQITLEPESAVSVVFPVAPFPRLQSTRAGPSMNARKEHVEIEVKALSAYEGDVVIKKMYIKNEGKPRSKSWSITLDPEGKLGDAGSGQSDWTVITNKVDKRQTIKLPLKFPEDTIPDTQSCSLSIHGNLLGDTVPSGDFDVSKLLKLPKGCGEQNMITLGPLIYSTKYLLRTGKLTGPLEATAYDLIVKGYESQLAYKKKDGSFSAWQHYPSSSWLTAFVTKVFCQASTFDHIGQKVREHVVDAVNWLVRTAQESSSGKFIEPHVIIHKDMAGQSLMNDVTLTSFIVECIARCKDVINLSSREFSYPMRKAVKYLERNRNSQAGKPYSQAILTYALTLMDSTHKLEANQRLRSMSNLDTVTGMRYWSLNGQAPNHNEPSWYTKAPPAVAIETASYALLTQLAISNQESYFTYSGPIASWLIRQRSKAGSFSSTTDTVLGLEALAEYAAASNTRSSLDMRVTLYTNGVGQTMELKEATALQPINMENLPIDGTLNVVATGTGLAQFQVECTYNSPATDDKNCPFTLEVTASDYVTKEGELGFLDDLDDDSDEDDRSRFGRSVGDGTGTGVATTIISRVRYNGVETVGMSILEVSLYSGFRPRLEDLKKLKSDGIVDEYEITGSSIIFYLKKISNIDDTLVTFTAIQDVRVGKTQPVAVKVYDYYEPNSRQCTKFYHPQARSSLLAKTCETSQGRKVCDCVAGTCAEYWGFDSAHLPRGRGAKLKSRRVLQDEACGKYDYVFKVKAGQTLLNNPLKEMIATIHNVIKLGSENLENGEQVHFVWSAECPYPLMEANADYLVMGMDGQSYTGKDGRVKMKYVLDQSTYVVKWPGSRNPKYSAAVAAFANQLTRDGCRQ